MNSSIAFLALAIASAGYIVATQCYWLKFEVARQSGHRLYLSVVSIGFVLSLASAFLISPFLANSDKNYTLALAAVTLVLSLLVTVGYNKLTKDAKQKGTLKAWSKNDLEAVCSKAMLNQWPVAVTLETRKVYVGFVADTLEPSQDDSYLSIIPIHSGYRDEHTMEFTLIHTYQSIVQQLKQEDISKDNSYERLFIVIPRDRVVTLNIFNDHLYSQIAGKNLPT